MKINILGNIIGQSGYAIHTASLAKALNKKTDVSIEQTAFHENWEKAVDDDLLIELIRKDNGKNINIAVMTPPYWQLKISQRPERFIGFLVFEGSKIPRHWVKICNEIKQIFVPSTHTKKACRGVKTRIDVIPHGVDPELFNPEIEPENSLKSDKFTFFFNGGWSQGVNDRKAFHTLLQAFTEEFSKEERVRLLAKINMAYNPPNWNLNNEILKLNLKPLDERPEVMITTQNIPFNKMASLYRVADCFVCVSKAEAFGMVFSEAMACGLPVITTNYGGQTDFIKDKEYGLLIGGKLFQATDSNPIYEEALWLEPSVIELRESLRYAFENQKEMKKMGKKASKFILKHYTWDKTADKIIKAIK